MSLQFLPLIKQVKTDWSKVLLKIYKKKDAEMAQLEADIDAMNQKFDNYYEIYPPPELIFNAFNFFNFNQLKVVIIGQDPYINPGQAMGLSFSVPKGITIPPSLRNIYKELQMEYPDFVIPKHGDLTPWAKQGVLLLNATLTVLHGNSNIHEAFWKKTKFTDDIIKYISGKYKGIIFVLWGGFAKKKKSLIDTERHYVLEGGHPSPLSQKYWFGCGHFKKINQILEEIDEEPIDWQV